MNQSSVIFSPVPWLMCTVFEQPNFAEIHPLLRLRAACGSQEAEWMASSPLRRQQAMCQLSGKHIPLFSYPLSQLYFTALVSTEKLNINCIGNTAFQLINVPEIQLFLFFCFSFFTHKEWKFDHRFNSAANAMFIIRNNKLNYCFRSCLLYANNNQYDVIYISHGYAFPQFINKDIILFIC